MVKKVLFLCTGNSCRSQIAEAVVNTLHGGQWQAFSAGTDPVGYTHPMAIEVLAEMGIQHQGLSKHVDTFKNIELDLVITVCDSAASTCPTWLGNENQRHIGFNDPAQITGSEQEILTGFRQVRDLITAEIPPILGIRDS
ncbi:MAG: arsenate reductase ArsC [Chloroflexota bacterium]